MGATATGNAILGNSIYSNAGLGIDLGDDGVTANDTGDGDAGANNLQNFPVLSAAIDQPTVTSTSRGSLNSAASTTYRMEFFASERGRRLPTRGFGEGQRYLGSTNVTTNATGNAVFGVTLAAVRGRGRVRHRDRDRPLEQHLGVQRAPSRRSGRWS